MGHFGLRHLSPLRKSFVPSRRQSRQTGPVYRAIGSVSSSCESCKMERDACLHPLACLGSHRETCSHPRPLVFSAPAAAHRKIACGRVSRSSLASVVRSFLDDFTLSARSQHLEPAVGYTPPLAAPFPAPTAQDVRRLLSAPSRSIVRC